MQLLRGLEYLHHNFIIHRSVSDNNLNWRVLSVGARWCRTSAGTQLRVINRQTREKRKAVYWYKKQDGVFGVIWLILHSNLIRDLKVSNLLMTDKGCVKIGKSSSLPQHNHCCSSHSQLSNSIICAPPFTLNTSAGLWTLTVSDQRDLRPESISNCNLSKILPFTLLTGY